MVKIMGHRGAKAYEPENTLRSIRRALELGVHAVEIDIHLSRDGRLVVIHDATVDRTTNGKGRVADLTWEELRRLDAGLGEAVPSLEEVTALVHGRAHLFIELKDRQAVEPLAAFFKTHNLFDDGPRHFLLAPVAERAAPPGAQDTHRRFICGLPRRPAGSGRGRRRREPWC